MAKIKERFLLVSPEGEVTRTDDEDLVDSMYDAGLHMIVDLQEGRYQHPDGEDKAIEEHDTAEDVPDDEPDDEPEED